MSIFYEMASRLGFYKDVKNCLLKGFTPCAVTGVSNIHKAQTAMALSRLSPCLVICDDEASAIRMTGDINEMAGEQLACVFPAKDLNFAYRAFQENMSIKGWRLFLSSLRANAR